MKDWKSFIIFFVSLLVSSTLGEDTVSEDLGVHQLQRLVEMLTSQECEDLLSALSHPEENIFQRLERLSGWKKQLDLKHRAKRETSSAEDSAAQCRTALTHWLLRYGERIYYDRLSRALQHIGRTDIAVEVGKNINQEKILSLKRYVDDFHKHVESLNTAVVQPDPQRGSKRVRTRKERAPLPLIQKGPLDAVLPLLYGFLLGFGGTLLVGVALLLIIVHISSRNPDKSRAAPSSESYVGDEMLE